jgi:hypothetical protein
LVVIIFCINYDDTFAELVGQWLSEVKRIKKSFGKQKQEYQSLGGTGPPAGRFGRRAQNRQAMLICIGVGDEPTVNILR